MQIKKNINKSTISILYIKKYYNTISSNLKLLSSTTDKLPDRKYQILKYLKKNENETKMSIRKIAEKFNIAIGTVAADKKTVIGGRLLDHDLSALKGQRLRTHGSLHEAKVPLVLSEPLNDAYTRKAEQIPLRSHQIFDFAIISSGTYPLSILKSSYNLVIIS